MDDRRVVAFRIKVPRRRIVINSPPQPQAYVMPDEPELTEEEYDALSREELDFRYSRVALVDADGFNSYSSGPYYMEDANGVEILDFDYSVATDIEKAQAQIIQRALDRNFRRTVAHQRPSPVYDPRSDEATKMLLFAVWHALRAWKRMPAADVIAGAIGLVVARICGKKELQHPRDLAKQVGVRAQTMFRIINLAEAEVKRLSLTEKLQENGNL